MSSRLSSTAFIVACLLCAGPAVSATFTVTNVNDAGTNSLRWAINQANGAAGVDTIAFNISGSGVQVINLASALPALSSTITLDATTQPGYSGSPRVVVRGSALAAGSSGLTITGANTTVRGLSIAGFPTHGVVISGGNGNVHIEQCWIGYDAHDGTPLANGHTGVWIAGIPNNVIGPGNVLAGNSVDGVRIDQAGATGNVVKGNRIGLRPDDLGGAPNGFNGIVITGAHNNLIGGTTSADLNVIAGNTKNGIGIAGGASGNVIERNYIGLGADGRQLISNGEDGVLIIDSPNNSVGGTVAGTFNVLSYNYHYGVEIRGAAASGNIVQRNVIGLDVSGTTAIYNAWGGIFIDGAPNTVIGGGAYGAGGNLISGNNGNGVDVSGAGATGTLIRGNRFGLDATGTVVLKNGYFDITLIEGSSGTTIGTPGLGNVLAGGTISGIDFRASNGNVVQSNYIGTLASGNVGTGQSGGISISRDSANNVIGGSNANQRNVVGGYGYIAVGSGATNGGNRIEGNWVGVGADGTTPIGSGGLRIDGPSTTVKNNVIAKSTDVGIYAAGANLLIVGNRIGTDPTGTIAMGNTSDGIRVSYAPGIVIGGVTAADRNLISANGEDGIDLENGTDETRTIYGNYIGTDINGTADLGNAGDGIHVTGSIYNSGGNVIGGSAAGQGNLISGNGGSGVNVDDAGTTNNLIRGNRIGTQADGVGALGNSGHGVLITDSAGGNSIGGSAAGEGNIIRNNGLDGVFVAASSGNSVLGNSLLGNGGLGIDLGANGVTANDAGDTDTGANDLQNFPVLSLAYTDGSTLQISGSLNSLAGQTHRIEYFVSASCDASGYGEGATLLGAANVTTDGAGNAPIAKSFATSAVAGQYVTATATHSGATSEFSACRQIVAKPATPTAGNGGPVCNRQTLNLTASSIAGASYTWTGPSGFTSSLQNPSVANATAAASGTYSVVATVSGAPSDVASTTATVNTCTLSINNPPAIAEGDSGTVPLTFTVSLSMASTQAVTVDWATANGTAVAPGDYAAGSGTLTIPANSTGATITRNVVGDTLDESNETFNVNLSNAGAGSIADAQGVGTITDDDAAPTVSIADKTCTEGNSGSTVCAFTITLGATSGLTVGGNYATASGGAMPATVGTDYTAVGATAWSIAPGQPSTTVTVSIIGDTLDEANETFLINLSALSNAAATGNDVQAIGTITDDDAANGQLRMSECVAEVSELLTNIQLTVERVSGSNGAIGVSYATANGSALAGSDYTATSGTFSWPSGDATVRTITVPLLNNAARENREDFRVDLSAPTGGAALLAPSSTHVWILDGQDQVFTDSFDLTPPCN